MKAPLIIKDLHSLCCSFPPPPPPVSETIKIYTTPDIWKFIQIELTPREM